MILFKVFFSILTFPIRVVLSLVSFVLTAVLKLAFLVLVGVFIVQYSGDQIVEFGETQASKALSKIEAEIGPITKKLTSFIR